MERIKLHRIGFFFLSETKCKARRCDRLKSPREELARVLGFAVVSKHDKYLCLPTVAGRSKREPFLSNNDRIWSQLQCWSVKKLSQAGLFVLPKTALESIPTYAMSCFRLPDYLLKELEGSMADFFWHSWGGFENPLESIA
ncbi:UNVERIFIED_CONTAM: hypothetical protein Sradi_1911300 [Sesamum radiatum]|uniref:Uncharacterized protein n=1 Tax=Sesamum radiatum TaxID=300843 RepID=A0AAW2TYX2_SESRA